MIVLILKAFRKISRNCQGEILLLIIVLAEYIYGDDILILNNRTAGRGKISAAEVEFHLSFFSIFPFDHGVRFQRFYSDYFTLLVRLGIGFCKHLQTISILSNEIYLLSVI
jgi:hypothetical protein